MDHFWHLRAGTTLDVETPQNYTKYLNKYPTCPQGVKQNSIRHYSENLIAWKQPPPSYDQLFLSLDPSGPTTTVYLFTQLAKLNGKPWIQELNNFTLSKTKGSREEWQNYQITCNQKNWKNHQINHKGTKLGRFLKAKQPKTNSHFSFHLYILPYLQWFDNPTAISLPAAALAFQRLLQQAYEVLLETSVTQEQCSQQAFSKSCDGCHKQIEEFWVKWTSVP